MILFLGGLEIIVICLIIETAICITFYKLGQKNPIKKEDN